MNKNTLYRFIPILCLLCGLSPAVLAQSQLLKSTPQHQQIHPGETPQGLSTNEWGNIQQQINTAKYRAHADENGGYHASNPAQGWKIQYAVDGTTTLTPDNNQAKPYHLGMKLSAFGYQDLLALHKPQKISQQDFTVSYQWNNNLRERWINSEQQLEQWFDIAHRPKNAVKGVPLTVQMTLDSELKIIQNGDNIQFTNSNGVDITYNKLKVWDSTGQELPARMQLASHTLKLLVDDSNARYPLTIDPSFQQQAYLKASNTAVNDHDGFGSSVAISGDTLVVGAPYETSNSAGVNGDQSDNSLRSAGAAYVFIRNGSSWIQQAYLKASNPDLDDFFGSVVAISGDTLVIGAEGEDSNSPGVNGDQSDNSLRNTGAAYVFVRNGSTWIQQAYLKASNPDEAMGDRFGDGDGFGGAVAISGDTLVVGAAGEDNASRGVNGDHNNDTQKSYNSGAAYVFTRVGTTWNQQAYLKSSNSFENDKFGSSVTISGNSLVVGAPNESSNSTGVNGDQNNHLSPRSGAAYVFTRVGTTWAQQAYLKASNSITRSTRLFFGDFFGCSVAISNDTVVVGAYREESNSRGVNGDQSNNLAEFAGAAYIFTRNGTSWSQQAYLKASNTDSNDVFGKSVSISGDMVVVGAYGESSNSTGVNQNQIDNSTGASGAAYVFTRSGITWVQKAYLKASNTGKGDSFGQSIAVSGDTVVVGARREDSNSIGVNGDQNDNSARDAGAAYVFTIANDRPTVENLWMLIETGSDDAEENTLNGDVSLSSSDLELIQDKLKPQLVGLRFALGIPAGATILNANIHFTVDETSSVPTELLVSAEATPHALTFSDLEFDISNRPLTAANIAWTPAAWTIKKEAGLDQTTPDLSPIVQEIVDQDRWEEGNSIAIIISGTGLREAESFEGRGIPTLSVTFSATSSDLEAPVAIDDGSAMSVAYTTTVDQQLIVSNGADDIVERNDNIGFPVAEVSFFDTTSAEGGDVFVSPDGRFSYTPASGYIGVDSFTYTLKNTEGSDSATVYIRVREVTRLSIPVIMGTDDAEEDESTGQIRLSSSDLELTRDDDIAINQQLGVRFQGLNVPPGAIIIEAYIQYTADEKDSEPTNLTMYGEASASAMTFSTIRFDISERMLTAAQVAWQPEAWVTQEQSSRTRTPDLSTIVQEIVDQEDWSEGNAIAFITTGNGKRVAESFNGTAAPVLHLTFSIDDNKVTYAIGDIGPAGGIVFHTSKGGLNGLEAAPENQGPAIWGCYSTEIAGANGSAVGSGAQNTSNILTSCPEDPSPLLNPIAAKIADLYQLNGVNDWFLPSANEALLMHQQRVLLGLNANFWTSTENSAYSAFYLRLAQGDTRTGNKSVVFDVWPIRAF